MVSKKNNTEESGSKKLDTSLLEASLKKLKSMEADIGKVRKNIEDFLQKEGGRVVVQKMRIRESGDRD